MKAEGKKKVDKTHEHIPLSATSKLRRDGPHRLRSQRLAAVCMCVCAHVCLPVRLMKMSVERAAAFLLLALCFLGEGVSQARRAVTAMQCATRNNE